MVFDVLVVGIILASIALGVHRGLAWQPASLVSLASGFVIGLPLSKLLAPLFGSAAPLNRFVALAVVYALVSFAIYFLTHVYRKTIDGWDLEKWDAHLGGVVGGIKGYVFCLILTFFAITLSPGLHESLLRTSLGRLMGETIHALHPALPPEVHQILHTHMHELDELAAGCEEKPSGECRH